MNIYLDQLFIYTYKAITGIKLSLAVYTPFRLQITGYYQGSEHNEEFIHISDKERVNLLIHEVSHKYEIF